MEAAIFIFYLCLFSWFLIIIPFFKNAGLSRPVIICLFFLKVLAGIAYAQFYKLPKYYEGADTWRFYRLSLGESKWLLHHPIAFIKDLFVYGYKTPGNVFTSNNTYWNDLKSNVPVKMMAIMNVATHSSYYADLIIFNFIFFIGLVALFKIFYSLYAGKKFFIVAGIFLLPSTLFWCSGIHKDGLILSASGFLVYIIYQLFSAKRQWAYIACIIICALLIFSLRNYVLLAFLPAVGAWWLSRRWPGKSVFIFSGVYFIGAILFFVLPYVSSSADLPLYLAVKQKEFLELSAGSAVNMPVLVPGFYDFLHFLPYALDMAFLRPHISEIKNYSYIPAVAEIILLFALVIASFFSLKNLKFTPFTCFLFFFSLSILLICGYTIPFSGAIVRYRSFVFPFLLTPLLCNFDFGKNKIKFN